MGTNAVNRVTNQPPILRPSTNDLLFSRIDTLVSHLKSEDEIEAYSAYKILLGMITAGKINPEVLEKISANIEKSQCFTFREIHTLVPMFSDKISDAQLINDTLFRLTRLYQWQTDLLVKTIASGQLSNDTLKRLSKSWDKKVAEAALKTQVIKLPGIESPEPEKIVPETEKRTDPYSWKTDTLVKAIASGKLSNDTLKRLSKSRDKEVAQAAILEIRLRLLLQE